MAINVADDEDNIICYDEQLLEFMQEFLCEEVDRCIFPKTCRACSTVFKNICEYIQFTIPKAHVLEDCEEVMGKPYTMIYRHCTCGNTLVMSLTAEIYPMLRELWIELRKRAEESGKPLKEVVSEFREQCDHYILSHPREDE
ncbi:hypothetical protein ACFL2Q_08735 [Thermodesulfobacteriota bacterium]